MKNMNEIINTIKTNSKFEYYQLSAYIFDSPNEDWCSLANEIELDELRALNKLSILSTCIDRGHTVVENIIVFQDKAEGKKFEKTIKLRNRMNDYIKNIMNGGPALGTHLIVLSADGNNLSYTSDIFDSTF